MTPRARFLMTVIATLFKSTYYLMDWNETPYPDHLIGAAALVGGVVFPMAQTIERVFYRERGNPEGESPEKEE